MNTHPSVAGTSVDSPYSWFRLIISLLISTVGGVGMWSVVVILPAVQAEFRAAVVLCDV